MWLFSKLLFHWGSHVAGNWCVRYPRKLHSYSLVAVGLSVGYDTDTLLLTGWHHTFANSWCENRLGDPSVAMYSGSWSGQISTIFKGHWLSCCASHLILCKDTVEDTEWFGVIFELPDVLVVEYQVISSSLLKGLWQGSADGLDVCEKYLVVSMLHLMINLSSAVYRQRYAFSLLDRLSGGATLYGVDFKNYEFDLWPR